VPLATLGWRWVFWASVPFSLAAVVIGWLVIPQTADRGFDWRRAMRPAVRVQLIVLCKSCGHQSEPDPAQQARWYGPETTVPDWRERLIRSRCGSRQVDIVARVKCARSPLLPPLPSTPVGTALGLRSMSVITRRSRQWLRAS
jgi:MFS family permease